MEAHEHTIADSVNSRATNLDVLLAAAEGFENADIGLPCRHCGELVHVDDNGTWLHTATDDDDCDENDTVAGIAGSMLDALDRLGVDVSNIRESAREAVDNYALEASVKRVFQLTLAVGGPTQWLSAPIERETYGWTRCAPVTFHDSWAVPQETFLPDESPLVALIDRAIEYYGD
jgi:hypothetical protein